MATEATAEIIPPPRRRAPTVEQAPLSDSAALLSAIEKAALNPQVDIGKVEQLLALYELATDMENSQTRSRYASYAALDRVLSASASLRRWSWSSWLKWMPQSSACSAWLAVPL